MVTVNDIQTLIILEVGDTPDQLLSTMMPTIWSSYNDKAVIFPRLQEMYVRRRCIEIVRGTLRNYVDASFDGALSLRLSERTAYLTEQYKETLAEITKLELIARSNRPAVIGQLVNTELQPEPTSPIPTPPPSDANSPVYQGSPYWPAARGDPFAEPGGV